MTNSIPEPNSLDLLAWLARDLHDDNPVVRSVALQELADCDLPEFLLTKIKELAAGDPDPTCLRHATFLANRPPRRPRPRRSKEEKAAADAAVAEQVAKAFVPGADPALRVDLLTGLRGKIDPYLLGCIREQIPQEPSTDALIAELECLTRGGQEDDAPLALQHIFAPDARVAIAATALLQQHSPSLLRENLHVLLASADLRVRSYAIRCLRLIDPPEALLHLGAMLTSNDSGSRHVALKELLIMPFAEAKPMLLRFIAAEVQPVLLVMAGLAVATNPDLTVPPQLYDMMLVNKGTKQKLIKLTVEVAIQAIQASGILTEPAKNYVDRLQRDLVERRHDHQAQLALKQYDAAEPEVKLNLLRWLGTHIKRPFVIDRLKELQKAGTDDDDIKQALDNLLSAADAAAPDQINQLAADGKFAEQPPKHQRRLLACVSADNYGKVRNSLRALMGVTLARAAQLDLISKIGVLGDATDADSVEPLLKSSDPAVVAEVLRALGKIDPDRLLPVLLPLLRHDNPRINAAALAVYLTADREEALKYLHSMLRNNQAVVRLHALSLTPLLDFATIEPMLIEFVQRETTRDLLSQAGYLLAATPSIDGLWAIYLATHDSSGKERIGLADVYKQALETAQSARPDVDHGALLAAKIDAEVARQQKPAPEYSYAKVAARTQAPPTHEQDASLLPSDWPQRLRTLGWAAVVFIVPVVLFYGRIFSDDSVASDPRSLEQMRNRQRSTAVEPPSGLTDVRPHSVADRRGSANALTSGPRYAAIMQAGEDQRKQVREKFAKENDKALQEMVAGWEQQDSMRDFAKIYRHPVCLAGIRAMQSNKTDEARAAFTKVLADPTAEVAVRCAASECLAALAMQANDADQMLKALDSYVRLMPEGPARSTLSTLNISGEWDRFMKAVDTPEAEIAMRQLRLKYPQLSEGQTTDIFTKLRLLKTRFGKK